MVNQIHRSRTLTRRVAQRLNVSKRNVRDGLLAATALAVVLVAVLVTLTAR
ncbi:MAG TPA: hypothetical protein VIL72_13775 [Beijerinckiaceae bacterium]|jgi:hypothetical protein